MEMGQPYFLMILDREFVRASQISSHSSPSKIGIFLLSKLTTNVK